MKEFVHLHNHSDYSLLQSTTTTAELVRVAKSMSMPGIAISDDGNLFGVYEFYKICKMNQINPIIGCDFYLAPNSRFEKNKTESGRRFRRILLLAENNIGYKNLIHLSSIGYTEGFYYKPRIDHELLEHYREGIIALSGGMSGSIPQLLRSNRFSEAEELAHYYQELYGRDNFFLELNDHGLVEEKHINKDLIRIAQNQNIRLVAANENYYPTPEDATAQEVLLCIGNKSQLSDPRHFKFSSQEYYIKSIEEMWNVFGDYPSALKNTVEIQERSKVEIGHDEVQLPEYHIPEGFASPESYLRYLSEKGLRERYPLEVYGNQFEEITKRSEFELDTIISMNFTGYFLIVWDFIHYAREANIPIGLGRGSGAGCIVAYALKITNIDPLKYGLLFERFLNPERVSMPDFDIDFCYERRGELIEYITRKYGGDRVGQIITFGTLKPRAVIRDVARVLGVSLEDADYLAKLIPESVVNFQSAMEAEPRIGEVYNSDERFKTLFDISMKLQGLHRHASTHAAGIVIAREKLVNYVPLFRDPRTGYVSSQFTMEQLEPNGLVKMDILGLKTLTLIERIVKQVYQTKGLRLDIESIPEKDEKTFELLCAGKSLAVFQFESDGMRRVLIDAKPSCVEDLIALNALFRPGPMENIPQFIKGKQDPQSIHFPHPDLESILKETYGVIVYQEQVMETVRIIAGFSLAKADILRRAMGKKKTADMENMKKLYMEGSLQRGHDEKTAEEIFEILKPFAGYGFNKSHAAAYALLAYKTAYLKAHFPACFMSANLGMEINNSDKFQEYLNETLGMGIEIHPPDINLSAKDFLAQEAGDSKKAGIIYGLLGIRGLGSAVVDEILTKRSSGYTSFNDFLDRVNLRIINHRVIETLVRCGVFDSLSQTRKGILDNLEQLIKRASRRQEELNSGQTGLFDNEVGEREVSLDSQTEYPVSQLLDWETEYLGYYFSGNPLDQFRSEWAEHTTLNLSNISQSDSEKLYTILALCRKIKPLRTRNGKPMCSGILQDFNGKLEFVIFPDLYKDIADLLEEHRVYLMKGRVESRRSNGNKGASFAQSNTRNPVNSSPQLVLESLVPVEQLEENSTGVESKLGEVHIRIDINMEKNLYEVREILQSYPGDCTVIIHLDTGERERIIRSSTGFATSQNVIPDLRKHSAIQKVWFERFNVVIE